MNRRLSLSLASFGAALAVAMLSTSARAAENEPAAPPVAAASAHPDTALTPSEKPAFKSFAIEVNPLAAIIKRYSLQAEWLPATHHAIVLNPHFDHVSVDTTDPKTGATTGSAESFTGFGAEVGYRFYTGEHGANGFFIGPSVLVAHYGTSIGDQSGPSFSSFGGAVDIGGQVLVGPGVLIGLGAGLQYTSVSLDGNIDNLPLSARILAGSGVRPRTLLTVGFAF